MSDLRWISMVHAPTDGTTILALRYNGYSDLMEVRTWPPGTVEPGDLTDGENSPLGGDGWAEAISGEYLGRIGSKKFLGWIAVPQLNYQRLAETALDTPGEKP